MQSNMINAKDSKICIANYDIDHTFCKYSWNSVFCSSDVILSDVGDTNTSHNKKNISHGIVLAAATTTEDEWMMQMKR